MARKPPPGQLSLFDMGDPPPEKPTRRGKPPIGPASVPDELRALAERLPPQIRLGTSSWSFPGWAGIVFDGPATETQLARGGLAAYAQHPLFRTVGIDRTYYAPITAELFAGYASQTPEDFRFLVKAHQDCTLPTRRERGASRAMPNPHFLDAEYATREVVEPCVRGLGAKLGVLVFQFSPMQLDRLGGVAVFGDRLAEFLAALPPGPPYAVELRSASLVSEHTRDALRSVGAAYCYNVHPEMPPIARQLELFPIEPGPGPCVVRWMLHRAHRYDDAKDLYAPFDKLVEPDVESRAAIRDMALAAASCARTIVIIANNKAEGSAPLTLLELARAIAKGLPVRMQNEERTGEHRRPDGEN